MAQSPSFIVIRDGVMDSVVVMAAFAQRIGHRRLLSLPQSMTSKRFSGAQLLTCLVLRAYLGGSYRHVVNTLNESAVLRRVMGLRYVPHDYTLKRFDERLGQPELVHNVGQEAARKLVRFGRWARRESPLEVAV